MNAMQNEVKRVVVGLGVTGLSCARHFRKKQLPFVLADTRERARPDPHDNHRVRFE